MQTIQAEGQITREWESIKPRRREAVVVLTTSGIKSIRNKSYKLKPNNSRKESSPIY